MFDLLICLMSELVLQIIKYAVFTVRIKIKMILRINVEMTNSHLFARLQARQESLEDKINNKAKSMIYGEN